MGNDTSKIQFFGGVRRWVAVADEIFVVVGGWQRRRMEPEFFIVTRRDGGWGGIQSQEEM